MTTDAPGRERETSPILDPLRAASAFGVELELLWHTGPAAAVLLTAADATSQRWVERLLLPAYGPHCWRAVPVPGWARNGARPEVFGRLELPEGGSVAQEAPRPWCETVLAALATIPAVRTVRWHLRAGGGATVTRRPAAALEPTRVPPGFRARPLTGPERLDRDRRERRVRSPFWVVELSVAPALGHPIDRDPLLRLLTIGSGRDGDGHLAFRRRNGLWRRGPRSLLLSEVEVAGILPAPDSPFSAAPEAEAAGTGIPIGPGSDGRTWTLPLEPGEGRHLAVVGETGMGKSSLLLRLAVAAASRGSVVLFDPIGDTGRRFLTRLSPVDLRRIVWVSPSSSPAAIDLVDALREGGVGSAVADRALGDLVDALRRVRAARYADTPFWGPRIEETLRAAFAAAAAIPSATLEDVERLLSASTGRIGPVPPEARERVDALVDRARARPEEVEGSARLVRELTGRPALRALLGAREARLRPRDLSAEGRITVVTGDAVTVGESAARYLLAIHLALFWSARLGLPSPPKTFLVLDEAQWYANDSLAEMLRLGRRANVHVWLATQSFASMPEGVREALRTNAADLAVFRGSPEDARDLVRLTHALAPESLAALPRGVAALLLGKGERVGFVRIPPTPRESEARRRAAEEAATAASRPYWPRDDAAESLSGVSDGPGTVVPARGSVSKDPMTSGPAPAGAGPTTEWRHVALVLWAGFLEGHGAATLRVPLEGLRRCADPSGALVRALGRRLSDSGLLVASERAAHGAEWTVSREGFERLLGGSVGPDELALAAERWRRVVDAGGGSAPTQYS